MSIKQRGRNLETKVGHGSKTVGRDVKKGVSRAGKGLAKGARIVGRDVKRVGRATKHGMSRVGNRLKAGRHSK
jgi:hypothetical protein